MSEPFLADIKLFGFNFAPRGWALCDGQILPINQYQALFSLLGTTYGGDGRTTFALPDLRGRAAAHEGDGKGLGSKAGQQAVTLTAAQMPAHNHTVNGVSSPADQNAPNASRQYAQTGVPVYHSAIPASEAAMNANTLSNTGANQSHDNMQPYLTLNFCIALVGVFPSRN